MLSLYEELTQSEIKLGHHETDLHILDSKPARDILKKHPLQHSLASRFMSEGAIWIEIPFAYEPAWPHRLTIKTN